MQLGHMHEQAEAGMRANSQTARQAGRHRRCAVQGGKAWAFADWHDHAHGRRNVIPTRSNVPCRRPGVDTCAECSLKAVLPWMPTAAAAPLPQMLALGGTGNEGPPGLLHSKHSLRVLYKALVLYIVQRHAAPFLRLAIHRAQVEPVRHVRLRTVRSWAS